MERTEETTETRALAADLIGLRAATDEDREFLITVYEASREIELAMTPWDAAQKRAFAGFQLDAQMMHYKEMYPQATHDIIVFGAGSAGRLYVDRRAEQIEIMDITVLPEYRKRGIATALVKGIQTEAVSSDRSVRVYVETFNPSQKLFQELGFEVSAEEGLNLLFEWGVRK